VSARLYFGKSLEEVLALEGNATQIPDLVRRCCDFIEVNGMEEWRFEALIFSFLPFLSHFFVWSTQSQV
jgi:hypothetical protein